MKRFVHYSSPHCLTKIPLHWVERAHSMLSSWSVRFSPRNLTWVKNPLLRGVYTAVITTLAPYSHYEPQSHLTARATTMLSGTLSRPMKYASHISHLHPIGLAFRRCWHSPAGNKLYAFCRILSEKSCRHKECGITVTRNALEIAPGSNANYDIVQIDSVDYGHL